MECQEKNSITRIWEKDRWRALAKERSRLVSIGKKKQRQNSSKLERKFQRHINGVYFLIDKYEN